MIAIIDCCGSNFASIKYAFEKLGRQIVLTHDLEVIKKAACVILPGVGHAKSAMDSLRKNNLDKLIPQLTQPVLRICLGVQIIYSFSEEGNTDCLNIFPEKVKAFKRTQGFSIPHMGWNSLQNVNKDHFLFKDIAEDDYVYFVHSFYAELNQFSIATNDLINGKCVRLEKGDFNKTTTYELEPKDVAKAYQQAGAEFIHVVDLDGAKKSQTCQFETIQQIRKNCNMTLQVGGGVKDFETIDKLLEFGVDRVVIGSLAVKDIALTKKFFEKYGAKKIVLALDLDVFIKGGLPYIATHGWQESSTTTLDEILQTYLGDGHEYVLCTDISRDGMLQGPNFELYRIYSSIYPDIQFMASGGVGALEDLQVLKVQNTYGVIIGKALYENKFTLQEALEC